MVNMFTLGCSKSLFIRKWATCIQLSIPRRSFCIAAGSTTFSGRKTGRHWRRASRFLCSLRYRSRVLCNLSTGRYGRAESRILSNLRVGRYRRAESRVLSNLRVGRYRRAESRVLSNLRAGRYRRAESRVLSNMRVGRYRRAESRVLSNPRAGRYCRAESRVLYSLRAERGILIRRARSDASSMSIRHVLVLGEGSWRKFR
jgi:hypothetical protein